MREISTIHLERAQEYIRDSRLLLEAGSFSSSISRSYYSAFHGAKAVLEELGLKRKSHKAVWGAFGEHIVKTGLMDQKYHRGGVDLFASRIDSDYLPRPADTREAATEALSFAMEFVAACRTFLTTRPK